MSTQDGQEPYHNRRDDRYTDFDDDGSNLEAQHAKDEKLVYGDSPVAYSDASSNNLREVHNHDASDERAHTIDQLADESGQSPHSAVGEPDHPCNYCKTYHWFSGPNATLCPPGTKVPRDKEQRHGKNSNGQSQAIDNDKLPGAECTKCRTRHWFSGPRATPCMPDQLESPIPRKESGPTRPCTYCGARHWVTGPNKTPCDPELKRNHPQVRGYQGPPHRRTASDNHYGRSLNGSRRESSDARQNNRYGNGANFERPARHSDDRPPYDPYSRDYGNNRGYDRPPAPRAITRERVYVDEYGREVIERIVETPYDPYAGPPAHEIDGARGNYTAPMPHNYDRSGRSPRADAYYARERLRSSSPRRYPEGPRYLSKYGQQQRFEDRGPPQRFEDRDHYPGRFPVEPAYDSRYQDFEPRDVNNYNDRHAPDHYRNTSEYNGRHAGSTGYARSPEYR